MIPAAELGKAYSIVHGDPENLKGNMVVGILHAHIGDGDSTSPARGMVWEAMAGKADFLAVTNHNTDGYDRASRIRDRLSRRSGGRHLEVVRAAEITAAGNQHVLVFRFDRLPTADQSLERLLENADKQGAFVSIPHPGLGDFSVGESHLEALAGGDHPRIAIEVHNGGAKHIDLTEGIPLPRSIRRRIPLGGSNARAKIIYNNLQDHLDGATGGPDAHNRRQIWDVITCGPEGMDIIEAIRRRKTLVMEKINLSRVTATNLIGGTIRSKAMERNRQRELGLQS